MASALSTASNASGTAASAGLKPSVTLGRAEVSVGGEHGAGDGDHEDGAEALHHVVDS